MKDIIIIGGGCAGLTAAVYARRAGKSVLIIENENFGGQIAFSPRVENFPSVKQISGQELANNMFEQAEALGAEYTLEKVIGIRDGEVKTVVSEDGEHSAKCVIIATGVTHRHLGLEKEDELEGISYCAVCDGAFYKGEDVAVVGGGSAALQYALYLSDGCKSVTLIHRRDTFRGEDALVNNLRGRANVRFALNSTVTALNGDGALESIELTDKNTQNKTILNVTGLFIAAGQIPQNEPFKGLISMDESGFIIAGEDCKTNIDGIFAAGDCRTKAVRQLTTAAADGTAAAMGAINML